MARKGRKEKQVSVRMGAKAEEQLRRCAAERDLSLAEYVRLTAFCEVAHIPILEDMERIIAAGRHEDDPGRYAPALANALERLKRGKEELRQLQTIVDGLGPHLQTANEQIDACITEVEKRLGIFRTMVEGFQEFRKLLREGG
jgi:hypothetical protein